MKRAFWKGESFSSSASLLSSSWPPRWTPEEEFQQVSSPRSKRSSRRDDWIALVEEELWRSVRAYGVPPGAGEVAGAALKHREKFVVAYDNRVVVHASFLNRTKHPGHVKMVRSVMDSGGAGNAIYEVDVSTSGLSCSVAPTLVINKQFGYRQCGILFPNTYFGGGNLSVWEDLVENQTRASMERDWQDREKKVFWRGTMTAPKKKLCIDDYGNFARLQAVAAASPLVDTGCFLFHKADMSRSCVARNTSSNPCRGSFKVPPYDQNMMKIMANGSLGIKEFVSLENFTNYRYLLNMPGAKSGSYSRNLNFLWQSGSIVFLWDAPFVEWYFPALSHARTHLAVSKHTLLDTLLQAEADPPLHLIQAARQVHDTFLCPRCIARYVRLVFHALRTHFGFDTLLDNPKSATSFFRHHLRPLCADLREILPEPLGTKRVVARHLSFEDPICGGDDDDRPPPTRVRRKVDEMEAFLETYLVDDCILDVVFDLIRSVKCAQSPIQELYCTPAAMAATTTTTRSISPQLNADAAAAAAAPATNAELAVALPATDIFESLAPFREPKGDFKCAHCGQKVSALRYAPHLDKCMGKGRGRRLSAIPRT